MESRPQQGTNRRRVGCFFAPPQQLPAAEHHPHRHIQRETAIRERRLFAYF
jgi:hypothetical protein